MAISINWATKVISVPQSFLTPLGGSLYELDTNAFRLALKDLEDDEAGMVNPDTHRHNTTVLLGGIEYARIIEILPPYTITFEDGQYAVNLIGSNNNIADRTNVNQVSVRPNNSAGLIQTREIQYSSFEGGVTVDVVNGVTGTAYPAGTKRQPVNNLADAMFIAGLYGFGTIYAIGDLVIDGGGDYEAMSFVGESKNKTTFTVSAAANVYRCEFYEATVTGTLDGESVIRNCVVTGLNYISGFVEDCVLAPGTITLGGSQPAHFLNCHSGVPGAETPIIDCGGDGPALSIRGYNGGVKLTNKAGSDAVSIDLSSGQVILDSTVTNGAITIRGIGKLTNGATGTATVDSTHLIQGDTLRVIEAILRNKTITDPATGQMTVFDADSTTPLLTAQLYENAAGSQAYRGQGAERRERLE